MALNTQRPSLSTYSQEASGEHELQTDIMRFLAILALCLMAVFALVQGLPQAQGTAEPGIADPRGSLRLEIDGLLQHLAQLRSTQEELTTRLTQLSASRAAAELALGETSSQLRTTEYRLDRSAARLEGLKKALELRSRSLSALSLRSDSESRELQRVQQRLLEARRELAETERETTAVKTVPQPFQKITRLSKTTPAITMQQKEKPSPGPIPPQPSPNGDAQAIREIGTRTHTPPPARTDPQTTEQGPVGFSLHFASDDSLRSLVQRGLVGFYARTRDGFWALRPVQGRDRFVQAASPGSFHEMTAVTVPADYRRSLVRSTGQAVEDTTAWGVTLPNDIERQVGSILQAHKGGALVIAADGSVDLIKGPRP